MFVCEEIAQAANDNAERASIDRNKNAPERVCVGCGITFKRRTNSKNKGKYCSRECAFANMKRVSAENREYVRTFRVSFTVARCICVECSRKFTSNNLSAQRCEGCSESRRQRGYDRRRGIVRPMIECPECRTLFVPPYGRAHAHYCSNKCSSRHGQRIARSRRRARERHADNDNVDPFVVFDRDGWRCQLCNIKTPRKLRGTYAPNAPELDHIIPLAAGGGHTYINTQCACRSCNSLKSDTPLGQLRLFG